MIKFENTEVVGFEAAVRGMMNQMNSWDKSDSMLFRAFDITTSREETKNPYKRTYSDPFFFVGENDHGLMMKLAKRGPVHAKFRRMITVYVDITAPLYWWKEFDTYKLGTVDDSCLRMEKEFTLDDFSHEHLINQNLHLLDTIIDALNARRVAYLNTNTEVTANHTKLSDKACATLKEDILWQMIQLLPSSYNQKRTIMLNYEVLAGLYPVRKDHKFDEWIEFCKWVETLPYSEIITAGQDEY